MLLVLRSVSVITSVLTAAESLTCVATLGVVTTRFTRHTVLQACIATGLSPISQKVGGEAGRFEVSIARAASSPVVSRDARTPAIRGRLLQLSFVSTVRSVHLVVHFTLLFDHRALLHL